MLTFQPIPQSVPQVQIFAVLNRVGKDRSGFHGGVCPCWGNLPSIGLIAKQEKRGSFPMVTCSSHNHLRGDFPYFGDIHLFILCKKK